MSCSYRSGVQRAVSSYATFSRRPAQRILRCPVCQIHTSATWMSTRRPTPLDLPKVDPPLESQEITYEPLPRSLAPRRALLLLSTSIPPTEWPPKIELESALVGRASQTLKSREIAVNVVYEPMSSASTQSGVDYSAKKSFWDGEEEYRARLYFADGKLFQYPSFTSSTLSDPQFLQDVGYTPNTTRIMQRTKLDHVGGEPIQVYVCTHGSRDCRCSDRGGPLVLALREEVSRRGLEGKVKIGEIAHVGGHKYAANALVLPSLDMFSNLAPAHAPSLISHLTEHNVPGMWSHWRGRYGLTEDQQSELWSLVDPSRPAPQNSSSTTPQQQEKQRVGLKFKTWEGEFLEVEAQEGETLLEVAKKHDLPSMEGTCGGNLECATCHCYLPSKPTPPPISEASDEELDMLGYAVSYRDGESRLGCQIKVTRALAEWAKEGGIIGLPRF